LDNDYDLCKVRDPAEVAAYVAASRAGSRVLDSLILRKFIRNCFDDLYMMRPPK